MNVRDLIDYLSQFEGDEAVVLTSNDFEGEGDFVALDSALQESRQESKPKQESKPLPHLAKKYKKEHSYTFVGDIRHPGRVEVRAKSFDGALKKLDSFDFTIFDEQDDCLAFDWNGDEDTVEVDP